MAKLNVGQTNANVIAAFQAALAAVRTDIIQDLSPAEKLRARENINAAENTNVQQQLDVLTARMDEFASLPDGSTAGDAELLDIRVGYNGKTWPSAGDAVRGQVGNLNNELTSLYLDTIGLFSPIFYGNEYTGNAINLEITDVGIMSIESESSNPLLISGKNMFDDSYMSGIKTSNAHEFYGMGADFNNLPVYQFNNIGAGMKLSMSVKPETDLSMEMALNINYTNGTSRKEYFYNFADTNTWVRKSINIAYTDRVVSSISIVCTKNTASKVFVKDIMLEKSTSLTTFEPFSGERVTIDAGGTIQRYAKSGQNNVVCLNASNNISVNVLSNPLPIKNKNDIASIKEDLYSFVVTDQVNVEENRTVTSGTWGVIPKQSADQIIITPSFDAESGAYTVSHYALSGNDQTATLIDSSTHSIGESVSFDNVTQKDYFVFTSSNGYLNYRNDSEQTFLTKFAYLSNGKAIDYGNSQIAGVIKFKNNVPQIADKQFSGKTVVFFGDSRTWYDGKAYTAGTKPEWAGRTCVGYQQAVIDLTGCNAINKGFSGYTSAQICAQIKLYDFTDVYAVYLSGGVNDFIKYDEIDIGEIQPIGSTFDTSTSYGAWQDAIEFLLTNYPQLKIYIDTPWICWNWYGNILPENIAEVKKNVAELYSIKCLDMYHISGLNVVNRDYFYVDDISGNAQTRLHMNDYGNKWVGDIIGKYLLSY